LAEYIEGILSEYGLKDSFIRSYISDNVFSNDSASDLLTRDPEKQIYCISYIFNHIIHALLSTTDNIEMDKQIPINIKVIRKVCTLAKQLSCSINLRPL